MVVKLLFSTLLAAAFSICGCSTVPAPESTTLSVDQYAAGAGGISEYGAGPSYDPLLIQNTADADADTADVDADTADADTADADTADADTADADTADADADTADADEAGTVVESGDDADDEVPDIIEYGEEGDLPTEPEEEDDIILDVGDEDPPELQFLTLYEFLEQNRSAGSGRDNFNKTIKKLGERAERTGRSYHRWVQALNPGF